MQNTEVAFGGRGYTLWKLAEVQDHLSSPEEAMQLDPASVVHFESVGQELLHKLEKLEQAIAMAEGLVFKVVQDLEKPSEKVERYLHCRVLGTLVQMSAELEIQFGA